MSTELEYFIYNFNIRMDTFQGMVASFDGMNDCHKAELNVIRKLCKEHVQQTFSTDKINVSVHDSSFHVPV